MAVSLFWPPLLVSSEAHSTSMISMTKPGMHIKSRRCHILYVFRFIVFTQNVSIVCAGTCGIALSPHAHIFNFMSATFAAVALFFAPLRRPLVSGVLFFDSGKNTQEKNVNGQILSALCKIALATLGS